MTTTSISNIQSSLAKLQENLPAFRQYIKDNYATSLKTGQWGSEKEYTPNGLVGGIQNIITDLTCLVENPEYFIRLSTYDDRSSIHSYLSQLSSYVSNPSPSNIVSPLDYLKKLLRPYNLRTDRKRMIVFQQKIDELTRKAEQLTRVLKEIQNKESNINQIASDVSDQANIISEKKELIETLLKQSEETKEQLDNLKEELEEVAENTRSSQSASSEAKTKTIAYRDEVQEFVEEINEHQKQIEKQNAQFEVFKETLDKNTTEQRQYLEDALKLIEQSKLALSYTTSVGLSSSFDTQCQELKGKCGYKLWIWMVAAIITIIGVILIGVWLINGNHQVSNENISPMWMQIVGKISMIPLLVTATVFCAKQYTKQRNLLEDYAYKRTLAQSMVAFSEELREKDSERYREYLSMVLSEIHQDPLRYRVNPNAKEESKADVLVSEEALKFTERVLSFIQKKGVE